MITLDNTMKLFIQSDLVHAANTVDGPKNGEVLSIVLEKADGARYVHPTTFTAFEIICDERTDYETVVMARDEAMGEAEALMADIANGKTIDLDRWQAVQPAYGSQAYDAGGWEQINLDAEMRDPF